MTPKYKPIRIRDHKQAEFDISLIADILEEYGVNPRFVPMTETIRHKRSNTDYQWRK